VQEAGELRQVDGVGQQRTIEPHAADETTAETGRAASTEAIAWRTRSRW